MERLMRILLTLLVIPFVVASFAQERGALNELVGWFPPGSQNILMHVDQRVLGASDAVALNPGLFKGLLAETPLLEIPFLGKEADSATLAFKWSLSLSNSKKKAESARHISNNRGGTTFTDKKFLVYRFADIDAAVSEATKKGILSPTGMKYLKRPVYALSKNLTVSWRYAWAASTGELLIAESQAGLRAMVDAGTGMGVSLVDSERFYDLQEIVPVSPFWFIFLEQQLEKDDLERMLKEGAEPESIDEQERQLKEQVLYTVGYFEIEEPLTFRLIQFFNDDEMAEKAFGSKDRESFIRGILPFPNEAIIKSEQRLEHNMIVGTTSFDVEKIKEQKEDS